MFGTCVHFSFLSVLCLFSSQEKNVQEAHSKAQEAKTSGDQALSKASELHAKELDELRAQAEVMKKDLSSSADKSKQLEKQVEELLVYKEQAQVSGLFWPSSCSVHKVYLWTCKKCEEHRPSGAKWYETEISQTQAAYNNWCNFVL